MLNKFIIPAALVATVVIAGIFAFMPVEKASTVHGSLTTTIDSEVNAQNRYLFFEKNYTVYEIRSMPSLTMMVIDASETVTVYTVVTATRNSAQTTGGLLECGAYSGSVNLTTTNATHGSATTAAAGTTVRNATNTISNGGDIMFGPDSASSTIGGVCTLMIEIDTNNG